MEEKKAVVRIADKEYPLKFTVGFWKKIKESCGVTHSNLEAKLNEDFGVVAAEVVFWGAFYGGDCPSPDKMSLTIDQIERNLEKNVVDAIEQAVINGMTDAEKRILAIARKAQEEKYKELEGNSEPKKD